jgi:hypothetical protein
MIFNKDSKKLNNTNNDFIIANLSDPTDSYYYKGTLNGE